MSKKVCIELHTDNNYVVPAIVTITSILANKRSNSLYDIRVLGNNLTENNIALFKEAGIDVIPHKNSFGQFEGSHEFVSSTDLFKFDLPKVLSDWDKVLYIDTDVIVQDDLSELFDTDLGDNYVAAVKDMAGMVDGKHHTKNGLKNYFNAGLMLLNLKKMREDNVSEKLIDYKLHKDIGHFMSQDALNCVFEEKVVWLHPKYNYMAPNMKKYTSKQICEFYKISTKDYTHLLKNAVIVHLTNKKKPWKYIDTYGHNLWLKYFKKSAAKKTVLKFEDSSLKERIQKIFCIKNKWINGKKFKLFNIFGLKIKISIRRK